MWLNSPVIIRLEHSVKTSAHTSIKVIIVEPRLTNTLPQLPHYRKRITILLNSMFLSSMHPSISSSYPSLPHPLALPPTLCSYSSPSPPPQCGLVSSVSYTQPCCVQHQWMRWHSTAQWEHGQAWGLCQILPVSVCINMSAGKYTSQITLKWLLVWT